MVATVFIDGEAGTTGLMMRQRLTARRDLRLLSIDPSRRKDLTLRRDYLNSADLVVLCLPDDAAREAVSMIDNPAVRVVDASTAHRVAEGWTFGLPELAPDHRRVIASASRIANPGCWSTGFIALVRPLVDAGIIPSSWRLTVNGVSGYSGGGRAMIEEFEEGNGSVPAPPPFRLYGLAMGHKHLPEMRIYGGLDHDPVFSPAVGRYRQGMIVEVPLDMESLPGAPRLRDAWGALANRYHQERFVRVTPLEVSGGLTRLEPETLNGTNYLDLYVFGSEASGQVRLVALLDNLGKGASGAAEQNINLILGLDEAAGL